MLTEKQIREHYFNPEIRETIIRISRDGENSRAGNGDFSRWYRYEGEKELKYNLASRVDYTNLARKCRSLYWTLNVFDNGIYKVDYKPISTVESPKISRKYTVGYTFGIDIDKEHGTDIHDPDVKKAVEDMAQYFTDILREYVPNSVYVAFSGGGIYILVHHKVFNPYYQLYMNNSDPTLSWDRMLMVLGDSFDFLIASMRDEFFKIHPEHKGKVKPDQLNNSQRVFKTIYSIHKKYDYAVTPLDPKNIKIDFEKASIPLKSDVIEAGRRWYTEYDNGGYLLGVLLKPFLEKAHEKKRVVYENDSVFVKSDVPLENVDTWPPCMCNLLNSGVGSTRGMAAFISFIGQIGIEEEKALAMTRELYTRWNIADAEHIFECYFRKMKVPTCRRLISNDDTGFPKGVSIKPLGVCKPDARCRSIPSPYYYVDKKANMKRLLAK